MYKIGDPVTGEEFVLVARAFTRTKKFSAPPHIMLATFCEFAPALVVFVINKARGEPFFNSGESGFSHTSERHP